MNAVKFKKTGKDTIKWQLDGLPDQNRGSLFNVNQSQNTDVLLFFKRV